MSTVEQSIDVDVPVRVAYDQWTQFESFPEFMPGVEEVRQVDDTHLHWRASFSGHEVEWDAVITEQLPDERVAWKATDGKANAGVVTFHRLSDQSSRVMVQIEHESDGLMEKVGSALGRRHARGEEQPAELQGARRAPPQRHGRMAWRGRGRPRSELTVHGAIRCTRHPPGRVAVSPRSGPADPDQYSVGPRKRGVA